MSFGEFYAGFAGIGKAYREGLAEYEQRKQLDEYKSNLSKLGDAVASGDYDAAARAAINAGSIDGGLKLFGQKQALAQQKANAAAFGGLAGLYGPGAGDGADGGAQPPVGGVYGYPGSMPPGSQGAALPPLASARPPIFARQDLGAGDASPLPDRSGVPVFSDMGGSSGDYLGGLFKRESNNNPNARASTSSAAGLGQFTTGTWNRIAAQNPGLNLTPVGAGQDGRTDPDQMIRATQALTSENEGLLKGAGLPVTDATRYTLHFLGGGGRRLVAGALNDPDAPAVNFVQPQQVAANRNVFYRRNGTPKSAGEVMGDFGRSFGMGSGAPVAPAPAARPVQVASADPGFMPALLPPNGRQTAPAPALPPGASGLNPGMPPQGVPLPPPRPADLSAEPAPDSPPMQVAQAAPPLQAPPLLSQAGAPLAAFPGAAPAPQAPSADLPASGSQDAGFVVPPAARAQLSAQAPQHLVQAGVPQQMAAPVANMAPGSAQKIQYLLRLGTMPGMDEGQRSTIGTLLRNELEQTKLPDAVKQYMFAKSSAGGGFDGSFSDFQNKKGDAGEKITAQIAARQNDAQARGLDITKPEVQRWIQTGAFPDARVVRAGDALVGAGGNELYRNSSASGMDEQTANFLAERVLAGDTKALIGLGRGAQGAENLGKIQGLVAQKAAERGVDATDILQAAADASGMGAQSRSLGTQAGRMSAAATEAEGAIALARTASAAVPRGSFVPLNRLAQAIQSNTGDSSLRAFNAANNTVINTFARAVSPTGAATVSDKEHAREMLSTADSPEAYEAVLKQMQAEIDMAHKAPQRARTILEQERQAAKRSGGAAAEPPAPGQGGAQPPPAYREGQTATNPKTGAKAVFRGGQWVPVEVLPPRAGGVL